MPNHFDPQSKSWMLLMKAKIYPGIWFVMTFQSRILAWFVLFLVNCTFYSWLAWLGFRLAQQKQKSNDPAI